jgi:hypothetical protein
MEHLTVERVAVAALVLIGLAVVVGTARIGLALPGAGAWLAGYQHPAIGTGSELGPDPHRVISAPTSPRRSQPGVLEIGSMTQRSSLPPPNRGSAPQELGSS